MFHHAKFDSNSSQNNKVRAIYTLGTMNVPLIIFLMSCYVNFFHYDNFSIVLDQNFREGAQKSFKELQAASGGRPLPPVGERQN